MAHSYLDRSSFPLGLRNNNPGNLRPLSGGVTWIGEISPDTLHNFSRFSDVAWGLRAMITDIAGDIVLDKRNTLRKLVTAYAPPEDYNNTAAYIARVSQITGIGPDDIIYPDANTLNKIIRAKIRVELGDSYAPYITTDDINDAFSRLTAEVTAWINSARTNESRTIEPAIILGALGLLIAFKKP